MKRRLSVRKRRPLEEPEIIVIPMIDVMMFLLFFFMVASLAMVVQNAIPVNLPKAASGADTRAQTITITLKPNGDLYLNTSLIKLNELGSRLTALGVGPKNVITINADEAVPHGNVIAVMDESRKAGIQAFGFATNRK